jgi:hypothetical protein
MTQSAQKSIERMRSARSEAELKKRMLDPRRAIPIHYPASNKLLLIAELELDSGTHSLPIYSNTNLTSLAQRFVNEHDLDQSKVEVIVQTLQLELKHSLGISRQ